MRVDIRVDIIPVGILQHGAQLVDDVLVAWLGQGAKSSAGAVSDAWRRPARQVLVTMLQEKRKTMLEHGADLLDGSQPDLLMAFKNLCQCLAKL